MKKINLIEVKIFYMCQKKKSIAFENLTMAPIEKFSCSKVLIKMKKWLNNYHKMYLKA